MIGFTVRGIDADGLAVQYPAPDDVLRDTSLVGWPVVTDARAALTDARCACIEAQGWRSAHVYGVGADGTETLVGSVRQARGEWTTTETPAGAVLVWVEVAGGPRLGYGTIAEAIQALEDEARETAVIMAGIEADRIAEHAGAGREVRACGRGREHPAHAWWHSSASAAGDLVWCPGASG